MQRLIFAVAVAVGFATVATAQGVVSEADYPPDSLRAGEQGFVEFTVDVTEIGTADNCRVTRSSSFPRLDHATCELVVKRARFKPALGTNGKPVRGSFSSRVQWRLPK